MIEKFFSLSKSIRYVAIYRDGKLESQERSDLQDSSSADSDKYEELIVNPTLLKLTTQRGNIDCGGLQYVVVRYGNFFQLVVPAPWGHVSICVEPGADPLSLSKPVAELIENKG